jgi:hypothetical protein
VRYIDLDRVLAEPTAPALIAAAEEAQKALRQERDAAARKQIIDSQRGIWVSFREVFETVFGQGCWYTESHNPATDNDVDHFRPKGHVVEAPDHGGYWWEAFNWRNFRYSSHRANRPRHNQASDQTLGKADHFPLLDESTRWRSPSEANHEHPALLDPTDPRDPPLLTFDQSGFVAITPTHATCETAVARFEATRDILHLDWPTLVRDRRDVYTTVWGHVQRGDSAVEASVRGDEIAGDRLKEISQDLIRLADDNRPYSRAAVSYICRFRDKDWVNRAVLPHVKAAP